jgi:hypothetical protein
MPQQLMCGSVVIPEPSEFPYVGCFMLTDEFTGKRYSISIMGRTPESINENVDWVENQMVGQVYGWNTVTMEDLWNSVT